MKWAGMYLVGFVVLVGGLLAALWKLGILESIGTTWAVIGVVILTGFGIMFSVANSGTKENIQIDRKRAVRIKGAWPQWHLLDLKCLKGSLGGGEFRTRSIVADQPDGPSHAPKRNPGDGTRCVRLQTESVQRVCLYPYVL